MDLERSELEALSERRVGAELGKYRLERVLGVGGMAAVYAASHRNGHRVAVKVLHDALAISDDVKKRFLREGYVANAVGHRGVVRVIDDDTTAEGAPFVVMELLEGATLGEHIAQSGGGLAPEEIVPIACKLLDVLAAAHAAGVVHRDIKPDNVFLTTDGEVKVLDFGIARLGTSATVTRTGSVMGTPAFMAPEQARGLTRQVDAQTDLWAVGAVLFRALARRHVFVGETPEMTVIFAATEKPPPLASLAPDVDEALAHVVDRALAPDKGERWPDARAMFDALAALPYAGDVHAALATRPSAPASSRPRSAEGERVSDGASDAAGGARPPTWAREILDAAETMTPSILSPSSPARATPRAPVEAPRSWPRTLVAGGALAVLAVVLAAGVDLLVRAAQPEPPTTTASPAPAEPTSIAAPAAQPPATSATTETAAASATAEIAAVTPPPTAAHPPVAAPAHKASGTPKPEPSAQPTAPAATAASCTPPWRLNANGTREYKLECFKK